MKNVFELTLKQWMSFDINNLIKNNLKFLNEDW